MTNLFNKRDADSKRASGDVKPFQSSYPKFFGALLVFAFFQMNFRVSTFILPTNRSLSGMVLCGKPVASLFTTVP